jgi:hypothetical protein
MEHRDSLINIICFALSNALDHCPQINTKRVDVIQKHSGKRTIFTMGNGGSSALPVTWDVIV